MAIKKKCEDKDFLTVGWDSEFQQDEITSHQEIISHQLYIDESDEEIFIDLIAQGLKGITYKELISRIKQKHPTVKHITLVSHFSRAELSSLVDGREIVFKSKQIIYSTKTLSGPLPEVDGIKVMLIDTMKFFSEKLEDVGEYLGIKKIDIGDYDKSKMKILYEQDYKLFHRYAMTDAKIAVKAYGRLLEIVEKEGMKVGQTIGGLGDRYLQEKLLEAYKKDEELLRGLGYEIEYTNDKARRIKGVKPSDFIEGDFRKVLYGGRNETFIKAFLKDIDVYDYDLVSAYVSMQTTMPTWDMENPKIFNTPQECYQYLHDNPFAHGFIKATLIAHKRHFKYPILTVKNDNALVFPLSARYIFLTAREFYVAYQDMETIKGFTATVFPVLYDESVVSDFMLHLREKRKEYKDNKDKFAEKLFKLIGNSTYGKFTQGYAGKKSINIKDSTSSRIVSDWIPHSKISNPFLSCYVTGGVRAIAYEMMKELNRINQRFFYWTTDGFATDKKIPKNIINGNFGLWSMAVSDKLEKMSGSRTLLDLKHKGKGWISMKTRGYAILEKFDEKSEDDVIFSFTGIQMRGKSHKEKVEKITEDILKLERFGNTKYTVEWITPLRDWLKGKAYSNNSREQAFNYDFDFKRLPMNLQDDDGFVYHDTKPYKSIDEFLNYRELYHDFLKGKRIDTGEKTPKGAKKYKWIGGKNKLITVDHYRQFIDYVMLRNMKIAGIERINENTVKRLIGSYMRHERGFTYKKIQDGLGLKEKGAREASDTKIDKKYEKGLLEFMRKWIKFEETALSADKVSIEPQRAVEFEYAEDYLFWLMLNGVKPERISRALVKLVDKEKSPHAKRFRKSLRSLIDFSNCVEFIRKDYSKRIQIDGERMKQLQNHHDLNKIKKIKA